MGENDGANEARSSVGANTFRNPSLVARLATTLDHLSGGRAILGLGGAWFELEHQAHGIDFGRRQIGWGGRIRIFDLLIQSQAPYRLATPPVDEPDSCSGPARAGPHMFDFPGSQVPIPEGS